MSERHARVLLVEDDAPLRSRITEALCAEGLDPIEAGSVNEAAALVGREVDLVLLDLGLPDADGLDLCRALRRNGSEVPIIVLTARTAVDQVVRSLDAGADDYISKPFDLTELMARIRSALRRSRGHSGGLLARGSLWLDQDRRIAGVGGREVVLRPREFDLLAFLISHPTRVWSRDQLLARVWGRDYEGEARTVDLHVRRVRAQIEVDPSSPRFLRTVWGVGYRLVDPDSEESAG